MRWWLLLVALLVACGIYLAGQPQTLMLAVGRVEATAEEADQCSFHVNEASLRLHPDGDPCQWMRPYVGKSGTIFFAPDK